MYSNKKKQLNVGGLIKFDHDRSEEFEWKVELGRVEEKKNWGDLRV